MRKQYIAAIWRLWREKDDGDWYLSWAEALALRAKATICVLFGLHRAHDYAFEWFGVGMVDFQGPYSDFYNGGQQATWTQIDVARRWSQWYYTDYTNAWQ